MKVACAGEEGSQARAERAEGVPPLILHRGEPALTNQYTAVFQQMQSGLTKILQPFCGCLATRMLNLLDYLFARVQLSPILRAAMKADCGISPCRIGASAFCPLSAFRGACACGRRRRRNIWRARPCATP